MNDSKVELGRRVDRHAHIGHGYVGQAGFEVLINHTRLKGVPKILETAKGEAPDGRPWDRVNLEALRRLRRARASQNQGDSRKKARSTSQKA